MFVSSTPNNKVNKQNIKTANCKSNLKRNTNAYNKIDKVMIK